jgi:hypothetical protein
VPGTGQGGEPAELAIDAEGNPLRHVQRDADRRYWLTSRLTGRRHFVPQTRDAIVDNGAVHPQRGTPLYSARASYAMGRADGDPGNGIGPLQQGRPANGFCHSDSMSCASCHAAWTNTCMGCHLEGEYNTGNNFSNITGERIVFRQAVADFVYQSPVFFQLGVNAHGEVAQFSPNTISFFRYRDLNGDRSRAFAFSNRNGEGRDPSVAHPAMSHNGMLAHSIRGRVNTTDEGPRYCVACHLTTDGMASFGSQYASFRSAIAAGNYGALDFPLLAQHIGRNPGNQLGSPLFVHMAAGLGSGLFLFDENGCAVNPLDTNANRVGCEGVAPASVFDPARVAYDLDRLVDTTGASRSANNHAMLQPGGSGAGLRDGAQRPGLAGPLGGRLVRLLTDPANGVVLDSWLDADRALRGGAANYVQDQ